MQSGENSYRNIRVYRKRRPKNINVQDSSRESNKDRTVRSSKVRHTDDNHQPNLFSSSSERLGRNQHSLPSEKMTRITSPTLRTLPTNSSSLTQTQHSSKLRRKTIFKNLAFAVLLALFVITLIIAPIIIVYQLSPGSQSASIDPCKSSRTLTFDDIGTNPFWLGASGYGGILPGYGGFTWLWANYLNVSRNTIFGTALVSGGYVAYIDNTNLSNILTISTNKSALFYICSVVVASVLQPQTPFTVWGIRSKTTVYTVNITINSTTSSTMDFSKEKMAVDTIEMFAYGNIFAFDNLVVDGP